MKQEFRKTSELKLWEDNPRNIKPKDFERLKKQIQELGQYKPLLITEDGTVIGGNMRLRAYMDLGIEDIWVSVVNPKDENQMLAYALSDNDRAGFYDDDLLANLSSAYPDFEWENYAVDLAPPTTLDLILKNDEVVEDEVPELSQEEPISKLGEIYQLGKHRLMCGDSTKIEDVEKLMNGQKADMVFTDPPYNVDYKGTAGKIKNDNFKNNKAFYQFLYDAISSLRPFVFGDLYICMSSSELHTLQKAFTDCGGHWSTFIIWVKDRFTLGRSNYHRQYEPILYGWFDGSSHWWSGSRKLGDVYKGDIQQDASGRTMLYADGLDTDVWEFDKPDKNREHPTMKPVRLCARGISNSCKSAGIVLDTFGGSGSTLIACEQLNRTCYMMELDPKYVDVIRKRYAKFIGKEEAWEEVSPRVTQADQQSTQTSL